MMKRLGDRKLWIVLGLFAVAATAMPDTAEAGRRSRCGSYCPPSGGHCPDVNVTCPPPVINNNIIVAPCYAVKHCRVSYFDATTGLWITADALVSVDVAIKGVFAEADIPKLGKRKAWIISVSDFPNFAAPQDSGNPPPSSN